MIKVIGVKYFFKHEGIDIDLTCQVLEEALGYSDYKVNAQELYCPYYRVCEQLVEENIMRRTKKPLVYALRKEGLKSIIKVNTKDLGKMYLVTRRNVIDGDKFYDCEVD